MADDLLKTYREKRNFRKTAEPGGGAQKRKAGGNRYLIQKHAATRLHFDLRLEKDGVLKSWAVTRGPSLDPADKRLAVRTEDHPLDYGDFEGTIPKGEYGGGTVMLWDEGTWEPLPGEDKLDEGKLKFRLDGARLKGNWMLVRLKNNRDKKSRAENWLLFKERDGFASTEGVPIVERAMTSVRSGRTMEEIAEGNDEWTRAGRRTKEPAADAAAKKAARAPDASIAMPKFVDPMMATLVDAAPAGDEWVHEIKYDGYRAIAAMAGGRVKIFTRNGLDWTDRFAGLVPAIADLPAKSALLDGEVAVPGADGQTDFAALQQAMGNEGRGRGLVYHLFDLLELDGADLRKLPLLERKAKLAELLRGSPKAGPLLYSDHVLGHGVEVYAHAEKMKLEGIVSKRADSIYRSERSKAWLKVKTGSDDEFLVVGWEPSPVKGKHFAALLLATREGRKLVYRGKVGSGFGAREQEQLWPEIEKRAVKDAPVEVPKEFVRNAKFVKPELVVTVAYRGISSDDLLRQASFKGLRRDKGAKEVDALDEAMPVREVEGGEVEGGDSGIEPRGKPARSRRGAKAAPRVGVGAERAVETEMVAKPKRRSSSPLWGSRLREAEPTRNRRGKGRAANPGRGRRTVPTPTRRAPRAALDLRTRVRSKRRPKRSTPGRPPRLPSESSASSPSSGTRTRTRSRSRG